MKWLLEFTKLVMVKVYVVQAVGSSRDGAVSLELEVCLGSQQLWLLFSFLKESMQCPNKHGSHEASQSQVLG